jgi:predicted PurR-regulated permease PerM
MKGYGERALVVLAVIAAVFLLDWGAPFFVPLLVGLLISYALSPIVEALTRVLRWRALAAAVVLFALLGMLGTAAWAWSDDIDRLWEKLPVATKTISKSLQRAAQQPSSPVAQMKEAAEDIEAIAEGKNAPRRSSAPVPAASGTISIWQLLWTGWKGVVLAATQGMVVLFLVFFMLASGDLFKRKLVKIFGDTLTEKKVTVQVIEEIDNQIRRYLWVLLVSNLLVGFGTYMAFRVMGVEYPELWGLVAGIVHTVPYFGPALIAAGSIVAAFLQFNDWSQAFFVSGVSIGIAAMVGSVFATWLASRETRMNTTASFVGLLFFGWIWGLWGVLLAIPLLAIVKTVCDHNEDWKPVAELLSK